MKRRTLILAVGAVFAVIVAVSLMNYPPVRGAYHLWRMNAAFNTLFGNPQPAGNGLASHDVTGIDVDAVMASYEYHREQLVELNVLARLSASFPKLATDGTVQQLEARTAFVQRMWKLFPGHKHYYLDEAGSFETWVPVDEQDEWKSFFKDEQQW